VERRQPAPELGLPVAARAADLDPLEDQQRRIVGDAQHLRNRHAVRRAQPGETGGLGREEARRRLAVGLREDALAAVEPRFEGLGHVAAVNAREREHLPAEQCSDLLAKVAHPSDRTKLPRSPLRRTR